MPPHSTVLQQVLIIASFVVGSKKEDIFEYFASTDMFEDLTPDQREWIETYAMLLCTCVFAKLMAIDATAYVPARVVKLAASMHEAVDSYTDSITLVEVALAPLIQPFLQPLEAFCPTGIVWIGRLVFFSTCKYIYDLIKGFKS